MNNAKITILIVNFNSSDFVGLSLYAFKKLVRNAYQVFIIDNGSNQKDYTNLLKISKNYANVFVERREKDFDPASMEHGTALNLLVEKVETPYFAILDADATFLIKDWDKILIEKMDELTPVFGTQAPQGKPQDFPLMFAILFRTKEFKELHIDFRPKDIEKKQDTGFEMREKYLDAGYRGGLIKFFNTRYFDRGPFAGLITAEYYLEGVSHIFASHFGRGSTLGKNKYLRGRNFFITWLYKLPFIGKRLVANEGRKEKRRWLKICKKIVDKQIF